MTDIQQEAIKRLIVKKAIAGFSGEKMLDYIMGKVIDSTDKRAVDIWLQEFDKVVLIG